LLLGKNKFFTVPILGTLLNVLQLQLPAPNYNPVRSDPLTV